MLRLLSLASRSTLIVSLIVIFSALLYTNLPIAECGHACLETTRSVILSTMIIQVAALFIELLISAVEDWQELKNVEDIE